MKKIFSIIFFILFIFSLFYTLKTRFDDLSVPYFKGVQKAVQVDVTYKNEPQKVFYNGIEFEKKIKISEKQVLFGTEKFSNIKNISFENVDSIEKINLYIGNSVQIFKEIPKEIKINNNKNVFEKIGIIFLSFFYNYKLYLISYLFLILFLSVNVFKIRFNHKILFCLITFLAIYLRIVQINSIPFWDDEVYVLVHTAKSAKLIEMFQDPGNPALYFIIFKIWRNLVLNNEQFFRYLALSTGILFNFAFYHYLKMWLNKKKALFGFFVVSISLIFIYFSQEIRCYMFLMLFSVLSSILFFKFKTKKNKILYFINLVCILNTHFYGIFLVFYNFLFGSALFFKNKKRLKDFILVNFSAFLIFLPNVLLKQKSLTSSFNTWIQEPKFYDIAQVLLNFSAFWFVFILFSAIVFVLYKKVQSKRQKIFLKYNFLSIISVLFFAFIFSYLIKPVFLYRYFYVIHPQYFALCIFVITYHYKTIYRYFLSFIFFVLFVTMGRLNTQNLYNNSDLYFHFVKQDIDFKKNNYIFFNNTVKRYELYENVFKDKANLIYLAVDEGGINDINPASFNIKKPCICYILNLYLKKEVYKDTSLIQIFKTPLGVISKVEYKN